MIVYVQNLKESTKLLGEFSIVAGNASFCISMC